PKPISATSSSGSRPTPSTASPSCCRGTAPISATQLRNPAGQLDATTSIRDRRAQRRTLTGNLVAHGDLYVEPVERLGVGADRPKLRARPLLPDRIGQRLDHVAAADLRRAPHHLAGGVEQDASLVPRHRGGVALRATLAIEKAEIERERRCDRGL